MSGEALLEVRDLVTVIPTPDGVVRAVSGISYTLGRGESLALVGESGSGKTVSALSLIGLLPAPARVEGGVVLFEGRDLLARPAHELRRVRGREIGMVFQDPATSLNPVLSIAVQLGEGLREHLGLSAAAARTRAWELLDLVGIPDAARRLDDYPHEFSGGQRQRILIAMAIACEPSLLIADEPTTSLDVTVQAQVVALLKDLQGRLGMALLWITHDLALIAGVVERVAVLYGGRIVEQAPVRDLFRRPRHPYTQGLLRALPGANGGTQRLVPIPGAPPDLRDDIRGCAFAPRCPHVVERCRGERPPLSDVDPRHAAACWRWPEL